MVPKKNTTHFYLLSLSWLTSAACIGYALARMNDKPADLGMLLAVGIAVALPLFFYGAFHIIESMS